MNKTTLLKFIAKAHRNTYAGPKETKLKNKCKKSVLPEHTDYHFKEGDLEYHDSYTGTVFAPGREVVFLKKEPVWSMAYQGRSFDHYGTTFFKETLFPFLQRALRNFTDDMPFRGPSSFEEGDFKYTFKMKGDYEYFTGQEKVFFKGELAFLQDVIGSKVE